MRWKNPDVKGKLEVYKVHPYSPLDVPARVTVWPVNFEVKVKNYLVKEVDEQKLLIELTKIYQLYLKSGVEVHSNLSKNLTLRHEAVIIELVKENIQHIKLLLTYAS